MKGKRFFLPGLLAGLLIGWALGYLRLPYVEHNQSFIVGLVAGIAFISLVWLLRDKEAPGAMRFMVLGSLLFGVFFAANMLHKKNETLNLQTQQQERKLKELSALMDSAQLRNKTVLVSDMLHRIATEMKIRQNGTLSDSTIARIAALSFYCKPYKFIENEYLSAKSLSPERGQLLTTLYLLGIDSACFAKIKFSSTFACADLRGTKFQGADLSNADLKGASFEAADLTGANLEEADLHNASFSGANLKSVNLHCSNMKRANLAWTKMNGADVTFVNLNGADLTNAQLHNANLNSSTMQWAQSTAAMFIGANMTEMNLQGTTFLKANLEAADLSRSDMRKINLTEAQLVQAELAGALVDEKWSEQVVIWQLSGTQEIQDAYKAVNDTTDKWKTPLYRLRKIQNTTDTLSGTL